MISGHCKSEQHPDCIGAVLISNDKARQCDCDCHDLMPPTLITNRGQFKATQLARTLPSLIAPELIEARAKVIR